MKLKALILSLICLFNLSFADEVAPKVIQKEPGKVECNDELKRCVYVSQNLTAKDLMSRINSAAFSKGMLSPSEGYINVENIKKLSFYIYDEELQARVIALIPLLDVFEDFEPSSLVLVTTEIFSLSEGGDTELQAQLTSTSNNPAEEIADWVVTSMVGGSAGVGVKIGTNLLSSILGSKKVREESSKLTTITQLIPNLSSINYNQTTNIYISPTAGSVKSETAGINVNGTVSISARDSDLVLIKDYSFKYGVLIPGGDTVTDKVNILDLSNPQLYLTKGVSSLVVSSFSLESSVRREYSPISFGKKKEVVQNKMMVVTRAEAISYDSYINDLKKIRKLDLHPTFSEEEINKFPAGELEIKDILNDLRPYAFYTASGDRVLGFKLNPHNARKNNIKKNIEVSVKNGTLFSAGSLNQKVILPLESLMITGLKFNSLSPKELDKASVKINLILKEFNGSASITKTIYYNPETNKFIE